MRGIRITPPELALIAGTRAALGVGLGFFLADRLPDSQRRAVGWTLLLVGVVSTIPLAFELFGGGHLDSAEDWLEYTGVLPVMNRPGVPCGLVCRCRADAPPRKPEVANQAVATLSNVWRNADGQVRRPRQ